MALHQQVLVQCTQRQLNIERNLHQLAEQEVILVKEKHEHENQYESKEVQEVRPSDKILGPSDADNIRSALC
jgi:hypothetical protein